MLQHLRDYNDAIVRLSDTLFWLLFACVFWIGWNVITTLRSAARTPLADPAAQNSTGAA